MRGKGPHSRELERLRRDVDGLFEKVLLGAGFDSSPLAPPGVWVPAVDVIERPKSFHLYAELPGIELEDVQVQVDGRRVELSGERRSPAEGHPFLSMESSYGPFRWTLELPSAVDAAGAETKLASGVLEVALPKLR